MTKKTPKDAPLASGPSRSAFADSAARLNAIARPGEQSGDAPFAAAAGRIAAISPDETWNRRFMSAAIGPAQAIPAVPMPKLVPQQEFAPTRSAAKPEKPGPIGAAIGKPIRRSLLSRVFGGR